jgi:WbqC-like protein family
MIIAIHQPHFIPWLGYLHRMAQVDLFIVLDHVQFERSNYQNRSRIRMENEARWLTVPVLQRSYRERILDKEIDNHNRAHPWGRNRFAILRNAYFRAGYLNMYAPALKRIFDQEWQRLVDLNAAMLEFLRDAFEIRTPVVSSAQLGVEGAKAELVLNLCRAVKADALLVGFGGAREYLIPEEFARQGVEIRYHDFAHPRYRQCGPAPFIPGLASVDLLFNAGPQSRAILMGEPVAQDLSAAA